ncbi:MAG: TIGR03905 family TSCPD domain-containing protein [Clostridiales bacterium]|nr:TIGR03905 family TSCPD domain-containing protein [Clostridiales bacterium]
MKSVYKTCGTCSNAIEVEIEDGIIRGVRFTNGCDGNLQGISRLVVGMDARNVAESLRGIKCGRRNTSCPDQLAQAIEAFFAAEKQ